MDAMEAIRSRTSIKRFTQQAVEREKIEQLLEAGAAAPNHYKVRPWRFVVVSGQARERLGDVMAEVFHRKFPAVPPEAMQKERAKPLRSPVIIAVGVDEPSEAKVRPIENLCASAAACENILLAARAMGLGGHWRTGDAAREPDVKRFLGFAEGQEVIAFLYIGYPEAEFPPAPRQGFADRTVWMD
ncbi:MAG TPA: nitroreductase [Anaerolineales bacterium]